MIEKTNQSKFQFRKAVSCAMVAALLLMPAASWASDDLQELGKAAEKLARAIDLDDYLNDFFFGAFKDQDEVRSNTSNSVVAGFSSSSKPAIRSKFTLKGLKKIEYKYGDRHRISLKPSQFHYRFTMSLW